MTRYVIRNADGDTVNDSAPSLADALAWAEDMARCGSAKALDFYEVYEPETNTSHGVFYAGAN